MLFRTPKPSKSTPREHQIVLREISQNVNFKHIIEFFLVLRHGPKIYHYSSVIELVIDKGNSS